MKNFPPFNYMWDTTQETNGWHQLEAWSFDRSQSTRKSVAVRVFVNNPGGRTERIEAPPAPIRAEPVPAKAAPVKAAPAKAAPAKAAPVNPTPAPAKAAPVTPKPAPAKATPAAAQPTPAPILAPAEPLLQPLVGGLMGLRAPVLVYSEIGGYRVTTPKTPVAPKPAPVKATPAPARAAPVKAAPVKAAPAKVTVERGTRIEKSGP